MTSKTKKNADGSRRRAFVTGASAGIGQAFAEHLARQHYDLVVVARGRDRLEALARRLRERAGIKVEPLVADLTIAKEIRTLEEAIASDGGLDLLVNNAGFATVGRFSELDPDAEESEICLNIIALVRLARAALPGMIARRRGAIINVSSLAAFQPAPYNATYGGTKAFVNSFTEALHEELQGTGVQVQALCPGFTRTDFQERAGIDASALPSFVWMTADEVVKASLDGLVSGELLCVPGLGNRALSTLATTVPRGIVRRISGLLTRQYRQPPSKKRAPGTGA
jgi:short-subunit dehydrogenase